MNKNYGKLKSIMLSKALAVGMLLPASSFAQDVEAETGGGLFGFGKLFGTDDLFDNLMMRKISAPTVDCLVRVVPVMPLSLEAASKTVTSKMLKMFRLVAASPLCW